MSLSVRFVVPPLSEAVQPLNTSPEERLDELLDNFWSGDPAALQELRQNLAVGLRFFLKRKLGTRSVQQGVDDLLDAGISALRAGSIHSGAELTGFLRIGMKAKLDQSAATSKLIVPIDKSQIRTMKRALSQFTSRDREAVARFSEGQHPDLICADLGLSRADFSELEVRLKSRFAELVGQSRH